MSSLAPCSFYRGARAFNIRNPKTKAKLSLVKELINAAKNHNFQANCLEKKPNRSTPISQINKTISLVSNQLLLWLACKTWICWKEKKCFSQLHSCQIELPLQSNNTTYIYLSLYGNSLIYASFLCSFSSWRLRSSSSASGSSPPLCAWSSTVSVSS